MLAARPGFHQWPVATGGGMEPAPVLPSSLPRPARREGKDQAGWPGREAAQRGGGPDRGGPRPEGAPTSGPGVVRGRGRGCDGGSLRPAGAAPAPHRSPPPPGPLPGCEGRQQPPWTGRAAGPSVARSGPGRERRPSRLLTRRPSGGVSQAAGGGKCRPSPREPHFRNIAARSSHLRKDGAALAPRTRRGEGRQKPPPPLPPRVRPCGD